VDHVRRGSDGDKGERVQPVGFLVQEVACGRCRGDAHTHGAGVVHGEHGGHGHTAQVRQLHVESYCLARERVQWRGQRARGIVHQRGGARRREGHGGDSGNLHAVVDGPHACHGLVV